MNMHDSALTKITQPQILIAALVLLACLGFFWSKIRDKNKSRLSNKNREKQKSYSTQNPISLKAPGGLRIQDKARLNEIQSKKKQEAMMLLKANDFVEAARIFEEINMQREAIEIYEKHGFLDEAAKVLMKIERPNRAAVIYERNRNFEKATSFYLRAKMIDDAKRCFDKIEKFDFGLYSELALLFAQAGDSISAFTLLVAINDRARILKIARDLNAYTELAVFLDDSTNRKLLLNSISIEDFWRMLQNMPQDKIHPLQRALVWVNEGCRGDFILPTIKYIGDKRDVAQNQMEQINSETLSNFQFLIQSTEAQFVEINRATLELCARALHDSKHWINAAELYQKLNSPTMAGKCWALSGHVEKALEELRKTAGDALLYQNYCAALIKLGINPGTSSSTNEQQTQELAHLFHNIDPDVEKKRGDSPFSIAS